MQHDGSCSFTTSGEPKVSIYDTEHGQGQTTFFFPQKNNTNVYPSKTQNSVIITALWS